MSKWIPVLAEDYITKPLDLMKLGRQVYAKWEKFSDRAYVR